MLLHDPVGDGQSQARSLTHRLGREERVEDLVADCRIDACTQSITSIATPPLSARVRSVTVASTGLASMALASRFKTT